MVKQFNINLADEDVKDIQVVHVGDKPCRIVFDTIDGDWLILDYKTIERIQKKVKPWKLHS